jgi:Ni/Co efflux regulator RcnB
MTKSLILAVAAAALCASPVFAQDKSGEKKELTEQQKRMQQCNADAKKQQFKDNDARQAFMSTCLKGGGDKMAACNAQADERKLHGAARDSFVKKCAAPS